MLFSIALNFKNESMLVTLNKAWPILVKLNKRWPILVRLNKIWPILFKLNKRDIHNIHVCPYQLTFKKE